jgi:hypothetical protein
MRMRPPPLFNEAYHFFPFNLREAFVSLISISFEVKCREPEDSSKVLSYFSWLALPHWVLTSTYPTRSMRLCYPWLVSRLFTHDFRESKLHHSLCCGLIEYHDVYCIRQAILTQGSTSIKDLRARGLHGWEHQSHLHRSCFFLEGKPCH